MSRKGKRRQEEAMSSQYPGNRQTEEQLDAILFETTTWTINERNGQVLRTESSPRRALDRAADFAASGAAVVGICRTPDENIIVFEGQAERLRKLRAAREITPSRHVDYKRASYDDVTIGPLSVSSETGCQPRHLYADAVERVDG
jgi:hypothetical protein